MVAINVWMARYHLKSHLYYSSYWPSGWRQRSLKPTNLAYGLGSIKKRLSQPGGWSERHYAPGFRSRLSASNFLKRYKIHSLSGFINNLFRSIHILILTWMISGRNKCKTYSLTSFWLACSDPICRYFVYALRIIVLNTYLVMCHLSLTLAFRPALVLA